MSFVFLERQSDSPFVEKIWHTNIEQDATFVSRAESVWEMVIIKYEGKTSLTIRGPETQASKAETSANAECFGITFKLGTFMPHLPLKKILDRQDKHLPEAGTQSFWLYGSAWQYPDYENADTFVARLLKQGIVEYDPVIEASLQDHPLDLSLRTVQRRFVQATGMSQKTVQQIERAQLATALLIQGKPILDTAYELGYYDQSHLTNSLTHFVGQTPAQIIQENNPE